MLLNNTRPYKMYGNTNTHVICVFAAALTQSTSYKINGKIHVWFCEEKNFKTSIRNPGEKLRL